MAQFLKNKRILLGVTGSIAAYKSADLVRRLRDAGAVVRVAMTENATRFITPLTMQAVSGYPVHDELFDLNAEAAMGHIELARWADLILIAPASADFLARLAQGRADDLLATLCLAARSRIAVAPAMNQAMWKHTLTQDNVQALRDKQILILEPAAGSQACGDVGPGRMMEPTDIVESVSSFFATGLLAGFNVVVTAGPTHEMIDPVRFMTNGSSGKMGYALAEAASEAGANVSLISGPVQLSRLPHIAHTDVISAQEMYDEVMKNIASCDIFLSVAAVSDYCIEAPAPHKVHKSNEAVSLLLKRTPDIVASVGQLPTKPFIVGFAAETENVIEQAKAKRQLKNMDMIVANEVGSGRGMGSDENQVTVITATAEITLPLMPKSQLARQLISRIAEQFKQEKT
jgi:phosphopantothenoylcysteine decarboxylase/phosphopantothenate--cysteine ligase